MSLVKIIIIKLKKTYKIIVLVIINMIFRNLLVPYKLCLWLKHRFIMLMMMKYPYLASSFDVESNIYLLLIIRHGVHTLLVTIFSTQAIFSSYIRDLSLIWENGLYSLYLMI